MAFALAIVSYAIVGLLVYVILGARVHLRPAFAGGSLGVHLALVNVLNRFVIPAFRTTPRGLDGFGPGISYNEYEAGLRYIHENLLTSVGLSMAAISLLAVLVRRASRAHDAPQTEIATARARRIVGAKCNVCNEPIVVEKVGTFCSNCEEPLHRACRRDHAELCETRRVPAPYR